MKERPISVLVPISFKQIIQKIKIKTTTSNYKYLQKKRKIGY